MQLKLPESKTYEVDDFREELCNQCGSFNVEPTDAPNIRGCLSTLESTGLNISLIGQSAKMITRDQKNIRQDPEDHYFMILQHQGTATMLQNDFESLVEPGDMFLVDSTKPARFVYKDGYSAQISMHLPRDEMNHRYGNRIQGGLSIDKGDPLGQAMKAILLKMLSQSDQSQAHINDAFHSVFGALLTERQLGTHHRTSMNEFIFSRALDVMSDHFRNPDFTTADLAKFMGVPLRQLQRAFKTFDETPHSRLQQLRLESAHDAILRNKNKANSPTISTIAFDHGFGDLSTFYRMFRKRYGVTPKTENMKD